MPFRASPADAGFEQADFARKMIREYQAGGIPLSRVHPQSFRLEDVWFWIEHFPNLAQHAVFLDARMEAAEFQPTLADFERMARAGLRNVAPPIPALLRLDEKGALAPTEYAALAAQAGLNIVTWTFESGDATDPHNWVYASLPGYMQTQSRMLNVLHALHTQVGISGIFSDWPATVTFYANCFGAPSAARVR